jgi:hypothetical protein
MEKRNKYYWDRKECRVLKNLGISGTRAVGSTAKPYTLYQKYQSIYLHYMMQHEKTHARKEQLITVPSHPVPPTCTLSPRLRLT